jgi:exopolyphosphatase / guanosine-5'-triphosphate,3'-diphosphate pyrophosphatase
VRVAAVDVGTNTVRLLVADVDREGMHRVAHDRRITRLGQGVDADRRLAPAAIDRTIDAIDSFVRRASELDARVRIVGTSAARDAANADAFARLVNERTGLEFEVISGAEEGRTSYLGATTGLPSDDYVVCDIGGGSTELSTLDDAASLDIGSVRLKERCLRSDPPTSAEIETAVAAIDRALEDVQVRGRLVGVAGTNTTLAAIVLGLRSYDSDRVHHAELVRDDVVEWSHRLLAMRADDIVALGPVERGRADVIGGGALILASIMKRFDFENVLVSERDILDGLVLDLAQKLA